LNFLRITFGYSIDNIGVPYAGFQETDIIPELESTAGSEQRPIKPQLAECRAGEIALISDVVQRKKRSNLGEIFISRIDFHESRNQSRLPIVAVDDIGHEIGITA